MRTFNNIMIPAFGLMAVTLFVAGFQNGVHFVGAAMSCAMVALAVAENRSTGRHAEKEPAGSES